MKNGESDGEGDVSGAESEHSNSSQAHDTSDEEEANECDSDDSSELDASEIERRRAEHIEDLCTHQRKPPPITHFSSMTLSLYSELGATV